MEKSGIPERYIVTSDDGQPECSPFDTSRLLDTLPLQVAVRYGMSLKEQAANGYGLLLYGLPGVGKTHIACMAGVMAMQQGYDVLFTTFDDALGDAKRWIGLKDGTRDPMERYEEVGFLLLDELGQSVNVTPYSIDRLFALVNHRVSKNKPTVYTSNTQPHLLRNRIAPDQPVIGAALVERIIGYSHDIEVRASESYRMITKREQFERLMGGHNGDTSETP